MIQVSTGRREKTSTNAANDTLSSGGINGGWRDSTTDDGSRLVTTIQ